MLPSAPLRRSVPGPMSKVSVDAGRHEWDRSPGRAQPRPAGCRQGGPEDRPRPTRVHRNGGSRGWRNHPPVDRGPFAPRQGATMPPPLGIPAAALHDRHETAQPGDGRWPARIRQSDDSVGPRPRCREAPQDAVPRGFFVARPGPAFGGVAVRGVPAFGSVPASPGARTQA